MNIKLKGPAAVSKLRSGGRLLAQILFELVQVTKAGVKTEVLDQLAREKIKKIGGRPAFLNYQPAGASRPYPAALCVSINDEVVHGIPSARVLSEGDIVTLDLGLEYDGMFTDMAFTLGVGAISSAARELLRVTREALARGVAAARSGGTTGDIGAAVSAYVWQAGPYGLVKEFGGHGVGFKVHEEPEVSNVGSAGRGIKLEPGLVIAIEPMVTLEQTGRVKVNRDGYTVETLDGSLSAHFEQTVLINEDGPEILTPFEL